LRALRYAAEYSVRSNGVVDRPGPRTFFSFFGGGGGGGAMGVPIAVYTARRSSEPSHRRCAARVDGEG
jgi:hypothetical protein